MKTIKIILVVCFGISCFSSRKKMAKSFTKEIASETVEKSTKQVGEEVVYGVGEKTIKKMDVDELIEFIRKNNGSLANSFEKLDKSVQKNIKKAIDEDVNFLNHLLCSNTLLDDFGSLVKNAPKVSKDINLLKLYAKSTFDAHRYGKKNLFKDVFIKETDGFIIFVNKADNSELARLRDGIIEFGSKESDVHQLTKLYIYDCNLLPNSVYKLKNKSDVSYLFNIDNLGRIHNIKYSGDLISLSKDLKECPVVSFDKGWDDFVENAYKTEKKVNYSITFDYDERNTIPDYIHIKSQKGDKISKTFRNLYSQSIAKVVVRKEGKEALEYLTEHNPELKELIEKIIRNPRTKTDWDKFVVEVSEDGKIFLSHREWPNSIVEIDGNIVRAVAGAKNPKVYDGVNYALNEFLSHRLPNKTYIVDDYMTIVTDELGRVKETTAVFEKSKIIQRNRGNLPEQTRIVESQGGVIGKDDGGHLIQMGMGGPNELINQVPMNGQMNKGGIWRKVEQFEIEQGWEQGKKVITKRRPLYKGDSGRPVAIEVDVIVDGKHAIIDGKQCPFIIQNP